MNDAPNRGGILTVDQLQRIHRIEWDESMKDTIHFPDFLTLRCIFLTFLLAAMRFRNFLRFRLIPFVSLVWGWDHVDDKGVVRPWVLGEYPRVKQKTGYTPHAENEKESALITCTCANGHQPITASNHFWTSFGPRNAYSSKNECCGASLRA